MMTANELIVGTVLGALTGLSLPQYTVPKPTPRVVREMRLVSVVDGDTYDLAPIMVHRVRLSNADTWESRQVNRPGSDKISDEELAKGKLAAMAVEQLFKGGTLYVEYDISRKTNDTRKDHFGRDLVTVTVVPAGSITGIEVGEWLKKHGHTR